MIFVTVGTHEQSFERLIKKLDELVALGEITDEIIIQKGYTDYEPKHCKANALIPAQEMAYYMQNADLIISHGGPATYMAAVANDKPTIVVPRLSKYSEHVNDHQLDFANKINKASDYNLTVVTDMDKLAPLIHEKLHNANTSKLANSNTDHFVAQFTNLLESLI